jgi:hypothetical protein
MILISRAVVGAVVAYFIVAPVNGVLGQTPDDEVSTPPTADNTINVRDTGAVGDGVADDTKAIAQAVQKARNLGPGAAVYLPAGKYLLASGNVSLSKLHDFTFYGDGPASVLMEKDEEQSVMNIDDCKNISVKKLVLDRAETTFTQGMVTAVSISGKTADVTIDPGFATPDDPTLGKADRFCVFRAPGTGYFMFVNLASDKRLTKLDDRHWRFHLADVQTDFVGHPFVFWWGPGGHGISSNNTRDCLIEDVTYYGRGANAGLFLTNSDGTFTFRRFNIDVPPGTNALLSCGGGGQEIDVRGKLVYDHCDFEKFDDDGVDILTTYTAILSQPSPNQIKAEHNESFHVGDEIAVADWTTKVEQHAKITEIASEPNSRQVTLTLDQPVKVRNPGQDPPNTDWESSIKIGHDRVVDYDDTTTSTEFLNCKFQCLRARPLNLKAQNCLVENCTFYNCDGSPISAGPEGAWGEAPFVRNLTIRHCTFTNNVLTCIDVDFFQGMKSCIAYGNQNILIEGNVFHQSGAFEKTPQRDPSNWRTIENFGSLAVHLHYCDGAIIRNNDFGDRAPNAPSYNPMILIDHCKNVTLENNQNLSDNDVVQQDSNPDPSAATTTSTTANP